MDHLEEADSVVCIEHRRPVLFVRQKLIESSALRS